MERVGGMAIMEGVFLRGPDRWAAATRRPDGGIELIIGPVPTWSQRWSSVPFARGIVALAEALSLGVRALFWSSEIQQRGGVAPQTRRMTGAQVLGAIVPALAVAITLFFVAPAGIAHLVAPGASPVTSTAVETAVRLAIIVLYLVSVSRLAEVRRVFANHGAEHKVVAMFEACVDPSVDAARAQGMRHPRCGTTFLAVVVAVSAVAHVGIAFIGTAPLGVLLAGRALLVPEIAAVAYEVLLLANRAPDTRWSRLLLRPGFALQSLTVKEPDDAQLEVALVALAAATEPVAAELTEPSLLFAAP